jgi:transcriptional regulator with XRE-family HTH domain
MPRRAPFDGSNQEKALRGLLAWSDRALRTKSGKTLKVIAEELSISPATLARYMSGDTPLRSDQFAPFAEAFETNETDLIRACFPLVKVQPTAQTHEWRAELLESGFSTVETDELLERSKSLDSAARDGFLSREIYVRHHPEARHAPGKMNTKAGQKRSDRRVG